MAMVVAVEGGTNELLVHKQIREMDFIFGIPPTWAVAIQVGFGNDVWSHDTGERDLARPRERGMN